MCHRFYQIFVIDTQQLIAGACRVGNRSKNVEYGAEAQFLADGTHIFHRGMIFLCEEEAQTYRAQLRNTFFRGLVNVDAQSFQTVCRTGFGGSGTIAVLGNGLAGCRDDNGSSGGDIKGVGAVTAGADNFQTVDITGVYLNSMGTHGSGTAGNFIYGFCLGTLGGQGSEKCGILCGGGFTAHDFIHHGICFVIGQVFSGDDFGNCFFNHMIRLLYKRNNQSVSDRKFSSRTLPWGVRIDSGWNCRPKTLFSASITAMTSPTLSVETICSVSGSSVPMREW